MSEDAIQNFRFRSLGRGVFVGGVLMTAAIHAGLIGLIWYGQHKDPPQTGGEREIVVTQFVQLGKPREKFWLPRIVQPPKPKVVEPTIKVAEDPNAKPVEREKEKPKPKDPEISKSVQDVLNRRRAMFQNAAEEPPEGSLTGSASGTSNVATEGDPYLTEVMNAIQSNWSVPTGLSIGAAINLEAQVVVSINEDGSLGAPRMKRSSGNQLYDDSCLQAVQATRRVPPPPPAKRAMYRRGLGVTFDGKTLAR